jgi:hypothetical protein
MKRRREYGKESVGERRRRRVGWREMLQLIGWEDFVAR